MSSSGSAALQAMMAQRVRDTLGSSDRTSEDRFDRVSRLAQRLFGVSSVQIRVFRRDAEWAKSIGAAGRDVGRDEFDRAVADEPGILMVADASEDPRFWDSPAVLADPGIIFFASVPIADSSGQRVGALQLSDSRSRVLTEPEQMLLTEVAAWVQTEVIAQEELSRAAVVQRSLAPRPFAAIDGYEVAGACAPSRAVGGDFYDWYPTGEGAAFTLADVMGKGVGAAIIAATVRAVIRTGARNDDLQSGLGAAWEVLEDDLDRASAFVTMFHARLASDSGLVRYIDAGHGLSFVMRADLTATRLSSTDLPLGLQTDGTFTEHSVVLEPGDSLVSVSDGVLDSFGGSLIGLEEVEAILIDTVTAQEAVDEILRRASEGAEDDVTALVVHRLPA
ncbi:PP2C family protein-serine/threonine phosphatase [Amnibacterium flavum]|uniref:PP2C family protein-serine/threonine phosphatase n=1 Tax=Amnibacterium flavum TaxID=2173173 RepID=UPI0010579063|nr:SpoIIE family protein phosphatase [Amnibacterium flavum]